MANKRTLIMKSENLSRRSFISSGTAAFAGLSLVGWPEVMKAHPNLSDTLTITQVIDTIVASVPGGRQEGSVDTVKSGDPSQICRGIVTTFMATAEVIQKAANLGANLIITHEPTYYNHLDQTDWLEKDQVYLFKKELIARHGIVIWRFHDYWHTVRPDGILYGLVKLLDWKEYQDQDEPIFFTIPATTLHELASYFKEKMALKRPFMVGDPHMACSRIALLPGAWGGKNQITTFSQNEFDVMVVGEVAEWETSEYIRDATFGGINRGLIILGHAVSEEPGMEYLISWLKPKFASIPMHHVAANDAFIAV